MAVTAIYFVPSGPNAPGLADLTDRLIRAYDPLPAGTWGLHHRVFRSTPPNITTTDKSSPPHFQHVLGLGHCPDRAFVHIVSPNPPNNDSEQEQEQDGAPPQHEEQPSASSTTVAIPMPQMEPYSQLLNLKFGGLWMYRMGSQVSAGASFAVGEFTVRLGELREKGGQSALRGTIVCIQTAKQEQESAADGSAVAPPAAEEELHAGQALVRDVWASFDVLSQASKETITSRPPPRGADEQLFAEVGLWCEALRFQR